jgi:hypothetical protein
VLPDNTEKNVPLSMLFDFQKYMPNNQIQSIVDAVGGKYNINSGSRELTDDELEVWAAGDPTAGHQPKKLEDQP